MSTATPSSGDETRVNGAQSQVPALRDILLAQLRAIGFALRVPIVLAAAFAVVATIFLAIQVANGDMEGNLHVQPSPLPGFLGALLPVAIWAREERFGPGFMWTLPVDRSRHALIRTLAGWLWLMGGGVLYVLCQFAVVLFAGSEVVPVETLHVLATPGRFRDPIDPAALRSVQWAPGAIVWVIPFAAATATYLLASAFMLGIRRPLRWAVGAVLAFPLLSVASHVMRGPANAPERVLDALVSGRYGFDALLTMRTATLDHRVTLTSGEQIHAWRAMPEVGEWRIAVLLWTVAGLLALLAAAYRHRERRRG